jgi:hypothetical protein
MLGIKENLQAVKEEISTEEQFLEGIIKTERFFKSKKRYFIGAVVAIVLGVGIYATQTMLEQSRLKSANEAYMLLIKDSNNAQALSTLKEKNDNLYALWTLQRAMESGDKEALKTLANSQSWLVKDVASYQLAQLENAINTSSELFKGFGIMQEGYALLQENKIAEAKIKFALIDSNSPLKQIAQNLEHYQGLK